jgi:hypothetical protein
LEKYAVGNFYAPKTSNNSGYSGARKILKIPQESLCNWLFNGTFKILIRPLLPESCQQKGLWPNLNQVWKT